MLLFSVAFALRLIPVLLTIDLPIGLDDMFQYDMLARNLAAGNGFRWYGADDLALVRRFINVDLLLPADYDPRGVLTSFRAPLYPFFLAGIYGLVNAAWRFFAARLAQALLGASLAPLTVLLARELFPEQPKLAQLSGWLIALYPTLWLYPIALATENLFFPLVTLALIALLRAVTNGGWQGYALAGLAFGLAALTRSVILAVMPLVAIWLTLQPGLWRERLRPMLVLAAACTLTITPWVARNSLLHGKLTGIESSMGYNLHMGYHPEANGTFTFGPSLELLPYIDDLQRDQAGRELAWGYIQADPEVVPVRAAQKLGHFFDLELRPLIYFYSNGLLGYLPPFLLGLGLAVFGLPWPLLMIGAVLGALAQPLNKPARLTLLIAAGYLLPHLAIMAESRFHLVMLPVVAIFAARAWTERGAIVKLRGRRLTLAVVMIGLLVLNWGSKIARDGEQYATLFGPNGNAAYFDY
jgi:hypothetical protein